MSVQQIVQHALQQQAALHVVLDITYMKTLVSTNVQMAQYQRIVPAHHADQAVVDVTLQTHVIDVMMINSLLMVSVLRNVQKEPTQ
jgi:hypothetical protein